MQKARNMIKIEKLYEATNGGLDIILDIYPQAKDCVGVKNKHFKIRDEKLLPHVSDK